jgi:hypothetical protein
MKKLTTLLLLPILAAALTATRYQDRTTEELPPEVAAKLRSVPNTSLLTSVPYPDGYVEKIAPKPPPIPVEKDCGSVTLYWVQVAYPITVCGPPSEPVIGVVTGYRGPGVAPPFDLPPPAASQRPVQTFKLTSLSGATFKDPLTCYSHYGPWLAEVKYYQECNGTEKYTLEILGVPSCPGCNFFTWAPPFENHPPELTMAQSLVFRKETIIDCDPTDLTKCCDPIENPNCDALPNPFPTPIHPQ